MKNSNRNSGLITDPQVEQFCQNLAGGMSQCASAEAVGRPKMWGNRQAKRAEVKARIEVLKQLKQAGAAHTYWITRTVPDGPQVLSEIMKVYETAYKDSDRLKALELLGRYRALFIDKTENMTTIDYDPKDFFKLEVVTKCESPKNNANSCSQNPAP